MARERHVYPTYDVCRMWAANPHTHYRNANNNVYSREGIIYSYGSHFPMGVFTAEGDFVLNGDTWKQVTSGHQGDLRRAVTRACEVYLRKSCIIPFSALYRALGDPSTDSIRRLRILDVTQDSTREVERTNSKGEKYLAEEHLLGGCLIKFPGDKDRLFISGVDDTGRGWRGLYFLTQLKNSRLKTVEEAYAYMKPKAVHAAEAAGTPAYRQGEFFFVEVPSLPEGEGRVVKQFTLPNKDGRTGRHTVSKVALPDKSKRVFAQGVVRHSERDHKQIKLYEAGTPVKERRWFEIHEACGQISSWSVTGNVD